MSSQVPSSGKLPPSSSSHRLPTISASDALRQLRDSGSRTIPTGLPLLDNILVGHALSTFGRGGIVRGQLTEIFGPPGSGRTAFGLQLASSVLRDGGHTVWIDCVYPTPRPRLQTSLSISESEASTRFHRYHTPTLAHLLALVHRQKSGFPPERTSLIIIDDISALFPLPPARQTGKPSSTPNKPITPMLQSTLLAALSRIASTNKIAVLLISHVTTRIRQTAGALLVAALGSKDWDEPISSRLVVFRDFPPPSLSRESFEEVHTKISLDHLRYVGVVKANGIVTIENDLFKDVIPFSLSETGSLVPVTFPTTSSAPPLVRSPAPTRKRRLDEVPDSEEDWDAELESSDGYGWQEDEAQISVVQPLEEVEEEPKDKKLKIDHDDAI